MLRQEFVVTLEIASPRDRGGLHRVEKILNRIAGKVDAVNTTTNAGGIPSLHSTETAKLVAAYRVEPIIQFCGRDHSKEEFLRQLERALEMGYQNFLLLTGDWLPDVPRGVRQEAWFPMDSSQMVHFANERLETYRARFGVAPYIGVAANPFSTPMPVSVDRLHFKRKAGARFCQTQAITHVPTYREWYRMVRNEREEEPKLTIPSIPLVGSRRAFEVLCRLPGVYVDESLHRIMQYENFSTRALEWAFEICEGVTESGAAGVHAMNFGMPPELIDSFLHEVRERAERARARASEYVISPVPQAL